MLYCVSIRNVHVCVASCVRFASRYTHVHAIYTSSLFSQVFVCVCSKRACLLNLPITTGNNSSCVALFIRTAVHSSQRPAPPRYWNSRYLQLHFPTLLRMLIFIYCLKLHKKCKQKLVQFLLMLKHALSGTFLVGIPVSSFCCSEVVARSQTINLNSTIIVHVIAMNAFGTNSCFQQVSFSFLEELLPNNET